MAALLAAAAVCGYLAWPDSPSFRGRSAAWWAKELERGRNSDVTVCGGDLPWTATLPAPVRRVVPVVSDPEGFALQLGDPAATPVLLALLRHPHPRTRAFAVVGLAAIQPLPPGVRDALVVACKDDDEGVRKSAGESLGLTVPQAVQTAVGGRDSGP